jgi:hypothetical protein
MCGIAVLLASPCTLKAYRPGELQLAATHPMEGFNGTSWTHPHHPRDLNSYLQPEGDLEREIRLALGVEVAQLHHDLGQPRERPLVRQPRQRPRCRGSGRSRPACPSAAGGRRRARSRRRAEAVWIARVEAVADVEVAGDIAHRPRETARYGGEGTDDQPRALRDSPIGVLQPDQPGEADRDPDRSTTLATGRDRSRAERVDQRASVSRPGCIHPGHAAGGSPLCSSGRPPLRLLYSSSTPLRPPASGRPPLRLLYSSSTPLRPPASGRPPLRLPRVTNS